MMQNEQCRNKGLRLQNGKILKGTLSEAPVKLRASSIPSKIENIIFNNHHRSAFGDSKERFYVRNEDKIYGNPGPGDYHPSQVSGKVENKKGFGPLISQSSSSRFHKTFTYAPGPGSYRQPPSFNKNRSNSKSTAMISSKIQARQLFKLETDNAKTIPDPARYSQQFKMNRSISETNFAFKSKLYRFGNSKAEVPPVGYYQWDKMKPKQPSVKFQSRKEKKQTVKNHSRYVQKLMGNQPDTTIGPGSYDPQFRDTKKTFQIKSNTNRFGQTQKQSYNNDLNDEEEQYSHIQSKLPANITNKTITSMFKSKTARYQFGEEEVKFVGDPWRYKPAGADSKSHIINFHNKWI